MQLASGQPHETIQQDHQGETPATPASNVGRQVTLPETAPAIVREELEPTSLTSMKNMTIMKDLKL